MNKLIELVDLVNNSSKQDYFYNASLTSTELINYIYNLNALGAYYLYNDHDGNKALKLLQNAKNIMENYVANRSQIKVRFDRLSKEEILTELSAVKDLPEIYTITLYFLARSYTYCNDNNNAAKYFHFVEYLGRHLGLFEGFLSKQMVSKIELLDQKSPDIETKRDNVIRFIELYKRSKNDSTEYILNYHPLHEGAQQKIRMDKDLYNNIYCNEKIGTYYSYLIEITKTVLEKKQYIQEIENQFLGKKGLLKMIKLPKVSSGRKVPLIYNSLGNILLILYDAELEYDIFNKAINEELDLPSHDRLQTIENVFNMAKSTSRSTYYTKADSYAGLIKVYSRKLKDPNLHPAQRSDIFYLIEKAKKQRDIINSKLKRSAMLQKMGKPS